MFGSLYLLAGICHVHPCPCHTGKVIQTPTLEASPSSSWVCTLVNMCLIPGLGARQPGLCLQRVSSMTQRFISLA